MSEPIRILHLEDNLIDAELVRDIIENQWPDCSIELVQTKAGFCNVLERGGIDLILADHSLPSFNGLTAMEIARNSCPYIPFIFVTGTLGEEVAIETLKNGATDYVLKTNFSRLIPAIERAVRDSEAAAIRLKLEKQILQAN